MPFIKNKVGLTFETMTRKVYIFLFFLLLSAVGIAQTDSTKKVMQKPAAERAFMPQRAFLFRFNYVYTVPTADLAKRFAEGPERNTNGIVGPVSLTQAHPTLVEKLQVAQPGVLLEPFRISSWWLVVRLERYAPATFNDEVSDQMCDELFDVWLCQEAAEVLNQMSAEATKPAYSNFSIS